MKHIHKSAIGDTLTFTFEIPDVISDWGDHPKKKLEFVRFSPDRKHIALGHLDVARVDIFFATDLSRLVSPDIPKAIGDRMPAVSWSADGRFLYATGFYWHEEDNVIVRWDAVDFKSYQYIPVKTRTLVRSIVALPDSGIAYISLSGDMYVLDGKGKEVYAKTPDVDHYSPKTFLIAPDASVVL